MRKTGVLRHARSCVLSVSVIELITILEIDGGKLDDGLWIKRQSGYYYGGK